MSFIAHFFASIGFFIAGLFGIQTTQPAQAPVPQAATTTTTSATTTAHPIAAITDMHGAFVSFNGKEIVGADAPTFQQLANTAGAPTNYSKDKNHVYLGTTIVQGADSKTFVVLSGLIKASSANISFYYAKDKSHAFVNDLVIAGADPATFVAVSGNAAFNAKDKNHQYKDGSVVQ